MKLYVLASVALLAATSAANASVVTVAGSHARACYSAAKARVATPEAISHCNQALTIQMISPEDRVATHVNRGILRMLSHQTQAAHADFNEATAMNPRQPEPYLNKGVMLFDEGNSQLAAQLASKALELGTQRPGVALYVLALAKEDRGDVKAAYRDLLRAAQLEPEWDRPKEELQRYRIAQR
jgi:tetratricopeptide (TPR) repeat protein